MFVDYRPLDATTSSLLTDLRISQADPSALATRVTDLLQQLVPDLCITATRSWYKARCDTAAKLPRELVSVRCPKVLAFVDTDKFPHSPNVRFHHIRRLTVVLHEINTPISMFRVDDGQVMLQNDDPIRSRMLVWFELATVPATLPVVTRFRLNDG